MASPRESVVESGRWQREKLDSDWQTPFPTRAKKWFMSFLQSPSPTPIAERTERPQKQTQKQLNRTAYLDGMRGFAAFLVYWQHNLMWAYSSSIPSAEIVENVFGFNGRYYFAALPGIRLFFSGGHLAVAVFFVISGYVLSAKPLSLIHSGDYVKLGDNLGSALCRRWVRLHLPIVGTTLAYLTIIHMLDLWTLVPLTRKETFREELWNWYLEFKHFSFAYRDGGVPWMSFHFHAWSLPVEFKGSVIIYTALLAFSRCTRNARLWCDVGLCLYFLYIVDGWYGSLFIMGMMLCDLDMLARNNDLPEFFTRLERHKKKIFYTLFVIGLYLGGAPPRTADQANLLNSPGWRYLYYLKPQEAYDYKWYFLFFAASCIVSATPKIWWLKAFFETRVNQYLGRISFALYLVHGPVLWTLGDRLYAAVGWSKELHTVGLAGWIDAFPLSKSGILGLQPAVLAPHLIILPVTLGIAELVTKYMDQPSVKVAQWLYQRTLGSSSVPSGR